MPIARILRRDAKAIFQAAVDAAQPETAVLAALKRIPTHRFRHIFVLGAGKASAAMAHAVEAALGSHVTAGLVNTKDGHLADLKRIRLNECSHPVPDQRGVDGARQIALLASDAKADDLVICLISGGGSALLPLPAAPITLAEKQDTTRLLLGCGATIHELNAVRKHLSLIKGGQLARLAAPATVVSLMLSDVVGDPLDVIGSGPTAPTLHLPNRLDRHRKIRPRRPVARVRPHPPPVRPPRHRGRYTQRGDACFARTRNLVIGSNLLAVKAAAAKAKDLGYKPVVLSTTIEGETKDVAFMHAAIAREAIATGRPAKPPVCFISGGETTVTIRGDGLGAAIRSSRSPPPSSLTANPECWLLAAVLTAPTDPPTRQAPWRTANRSNAPPNWG